LVWRRAWTAGGKEARLQVGSIVGGGKERKRRGKKGQKLEKQGDQGDED
jgi:hypothetical protein